MSRTEILSGHLQRTPEADAISDAKRHWCLARYEVDQAWRLLRDAEDLEVAAWRKLKLLEGATGHPRAADTAAQG
jgi:hypothetical protein